mgnify:CR=1 FL=1
MNHRQWECPDATCGAINGWVLSTCEACGTGRPEARESGPAAAPPKHSCWTCTRCKARSPGQPTIMGLCGSCHFDVNIRAKHVEPTEAERREIRIKLGETIDKLARSMVAPGRGILHARGQSERADVFPSRFASEGEREDEKMRQLEAFGEWQRSR